MTERGKNQNAGKPEAYEAPEIEDLENPEGPTVTAAGNPSQVGVAAPRDLG